MSKFRYVANCGHSDRTIYSTGGGRTIYIGCGRYLPEITKIRICKKYRNGEILDAYISAIDRVVSSDYYLDPNNEIPYP